LPSQPKLRDIAVPQQSTLAAHQGHPVNRLGKHPTSITDFGSLQGTGHKLLVGREFHAFQPTATISQDQHRILCNVIQPFDGQMRQTCAVICECEDAVIANAIQLVQNDLTNSREKSNESAQLEHNGRNTDSVPWSSVSNAGMS
jgi:hypothetical protein